MREALKVVVAVAVALSLWFVFDGSAQDLPAFDPPPAAVEPLEVTVYGSDECAPRWRRVSLAAGYAVHYPHPAGHGVPYWITNAQLEAAFSGPDGRVVEAALDHVRPMMQETNRIICRWAPLTVAAAPAD